MEDVFEGKVGYMVASKFAGGGYRIAISGVDGFFTLPESLAAGVQKGTRIKVRVERKGKGVYVSKLAVLEQASESRQEPSAPAYGKGNKGGNGMTKEDWEAKDNVIRYQAARNAALEYLRLQQELGVLKLGNKGSAKEILEAELDNQTARFYLDCQELGAVKRYSAQADESTEFDPEAEPQEDFPEEQFPADDDDF